MKITSLCSGRNKPLTTTAKKLTADPIEFLDLVIDHLTARGMMDPKLLYETPFTDFDTMGVEGAFEHSDVVRMVQILRDIEPKCAARATLGLKRSHFCVQQSGILENKRRQLRVPKRLRW